MRKVGHLLMTACLVLFSCEKVKEEPQKGPLKTYPRGVSYATWVYPLLGSDKGCYSCHSDNFTSSSSVYLWLQSQGLNKLVSQPAVSIETDSAAYWKEADSLLRQSAFYQLLNSSHRDRVGFTSAQKDTLYGWIIEGGANN